MKNKEVEDYIKKLKYSIYRINGIDGTFVLEHEMWKIMEDILKILYPRKYKKVKIQR